MTIAAKVSAVEIDKIVRDRYEGNYFEGRLMNYTGSTYTPGASGADAAFLATEVTVGTGGYQRQIIYYSSSDFANYADGGVALAQKGTTFTHDAGNTSLVFTHAALVWSGGNVTGLGAYNNFSTNLAMPTGNYTNLPVTKIGGSGVGLTVNLSVTNNGAQLSDYTLAINKAGYDYAASDAVQLTNATLKAANGAAGTGTLNFTVSGVHTPTVATKGDLFAVAKPASTVTLTQGQQAVFLWNPKQYGFYNQ